MKPMKLEFTPIKTRIVKPPKDEIWDIIDSLEVKNGDIVFITSKILSIHQGRTAPATEEGKEPLVFQEADRCLTYKNSEDDFTTHITITDGNLILASGIDASNANSHFVLWPKEVDKLCQEIRTRIIKNEVKKHHKITKLGIIATDSHTSPLRWGVTGFTIGIAGIEPVEDIRGDEDLFGRKIHITKVNKIDPLTSMAVLLMGESKECTPIAILRGYKDIGFNAKGSMKELKISPEHDIYKPLLDVIK